MISLSPLKNYLIIIKWPYNEYSAFVCASCCGCKKLVEICLLLLYMYTFQYSVQLSSPWQRRRDGQASIGCIATYGISSTSPIKSNAKASWKGGGGSSASGSGSGSTHASYRSIAHRCTLCLSLIHHPWPSPRRTVRRFPKRTTHTDRLTTPHCLASNFLQEQEEGQLG